MQQVNDWILNMTDFIFGILIGAAGGLAAAVLLPRVYNFGARVIAKYRKPETKE